ncbi:MAG: iron ABC transporter permease, partial [Alphaproteobacteria bacterium]|nr:iron ABC transporter permease [Alphaproteobacteria bacterium]
MPPVRNIMTKPSPGQILLGVALAAFLLLFLVIPVGQVVRMAFAGPNGPTLVHFQDFFNTTLFRQSFVNSFYVAIMSVVWASLIAVPLAYVTTRFHFAGSALIKTLGVVPLIMPPFVGAVSMQLVFGRNGSLNLLLDDWFGVSLDLMSGLGGVIFVEAIHYFPFILLNLSAALANIDSAMEESAQNLGSHGLRLFRRIVFPLAMPGYVAGASLVFVKVFDDLGTPLLLNVTNMLAPQAYLRITSVGLGDPMGYVISVIMVAFSLIAMWLSALALSGRDYATAQRGGGGLDRRRLAPWQHAACLILVALVLLVVLSPHIALFLLSVATVWSFSPLPDAYTWQHYAAVFREAPHFITNTILYAGLAALIDVIVGTAIAYLILRTKLVGRQTLDYVAMAALAIPGLVLGIGYLRTYFGVSVPGTDLPLTSLWIMLVIAYAIRRLPYALRSCVSALQQVHQSLEEAAANLGAGGARAMRRIVVPLMAGGLLAGFVTSFITAAVELSATLVLVSTDA